MVGTYIETSKKVEKGSNRKYGVNRLTNLCTKACQNLGCFFGPWQENLPLYSVQKFTASESVCFFPDWRLDDDRAGDRQDTAASGYP